MISVIICSRTEKLEADLKTNIQERIGVDHEIISIDNSKNRYSIFEAYNIGVQKSKYPYLCFMHDDIIYHSDNWGQAVTSHFADEDTTAIGIVGSPYYSFMPGPWWGNGNIFSGLYSPGQAIDSPEQNDTLHKKQEVVIFDGLWFCVKKKAFDLIKFDHGTFSGFHLYDADICLQMHHHKLKMYCVNDILIEHRSIGEVKGAWLNDQLLMHKKWADQLPVSCITLKSEELGRYEFKTLNCFIWICYSVGYTNRKTYAMALKYLFAFTKKHLFYKTPGYLVKFLFKYLFKKGEPFYS